MNAMLRPGRPEDAIACGTICHEAFNAIARIGPITVEPAVQNR